MPSVELGRRLHPVPRILALRVEEHLDIVEYIPPCILAVPVSPAPDPLALEQVEEALGDCVVVSVAAAARGMLQIVGPQKGSPIHTGVLAALIGMDQHLVLRLSPPDGHQQGLQDDICRLTALHGPADHAPGIEIDDHREVGEALLRPHGGDIGHPDPVQEPQRRTSGRGCFDHDRWLAAITSGAALVKDPRLDPAAPCRPCNMADGAAATSRDLERIGAGTCPACPHPSLPPGPMRAIGPTVHLVQPCLRCRDPTGRITRPLHDSHAQDGESPPAEAGRHAKCHLVVARKKKGPRQRCLSPCFKWRTRSDSNARPPDS